MLYTSPMVTTKQKPTVDTQKISPSHSNQREKRDKKNPHWKAMFADDMIPSLFADDMILHIENSKVITAHQ